MTPEEMDDQYNQVDGRHFDIAGNPISLRNWGYLRANRDYGVIAQEKIGHVSLSTVWVGLDMGFHIGRGLPPVIFETMIFSEVDDDLDQYQERYATEAQAREGHARIASMLRSIAALSDGSDLTAGVDGIDAEHGSPNRDEGRE